MKIEKLKINTSGQKDEPGIQWNDSVIAALGTMPDIILADKAGCSRYSIYRKRVELGIPRFDKNKWRKDQISLLGTDTDANVGLLLGKPQPIVCRKRNELGITKYVEPVSGLFTKSERITIHKHITDIEKGLNFIEQWNEDDRIAEVKKSMYLLKEILYKKGSENE